MTPPPPAGPDTRDTPDGPDGPFAVLGEPVLAVADERRALLAVAGAHGDDEQGRVGVFDVGASPRRRLLADTGWPVHAMAFHPARPLLAVGTGDYDGGYHFEGELLLVHLESGTVRSLIGGRSGRQVLALEWLDHQDLRVVVAPYDDEEDEAAHVQGHVAVVRRPDWTRVGAKSLTPGDLTGPRVPAPRPDGREAARRTVARLTAPRTRRHHTGARPA
ncbi:hypothetical protein AB0F71_13635 [Kitasatospora sp. NPDC028055]|uniref:hypothetical protein n=1 Tax=Kitasatospora sp. NPDC028055 TaxID=3155653 RepID=UPI0033D6EB35